MTKLNLDILNAIISEELERDPCTEENHDECESCCIKKQLFQSDLKDCGIEESFLVASGIPPIPGRAVVTQIFILGMKYGQRMNESVIFEKLEEELKNGKS